MENAAKDIGLDTWMEKTANSGITTQYLDELAKKYQAKYDEYEASKAITSGFYKEAEELEGKLVEAMEQAGKSKYNVEGIGTFYFSDKMTVPTPKTVNDKKKLFGWLTKKYGETFLMDKVSINHNTLQGLYKSAFNEHVEECKQTGKDDEAANFSIPGLSEPTNMRSLCLRKEKE